MSTIASFHVLLSTRSSYHGNVQYFILGTINSVTIDFFWQISAPAERSLPIHYGDAINGYYLYVHIYIDGQLIKAGTHEATNRCNTSQQQILSCEQENFIENSRDRILSLQHVAQNQTGLILWDMLQRQNSVAATKF